MKDSSENPEVTPGPDLLLLNYHDGYTEIYIGLLLMISHSFSFVIYLGKGSWILLILVPVILVASAHKTWGKWLKHAVTLPRIGIETFSKESLDPGYHRPFQHLEFTLLMMLIGAFTEWASPLIGVMGLIEFHRYPQVESKKRFRIYGYSFLLLGVTFFALPIESIVLKNLLLTGILSAGMLIVGITTLILFIRRNPLPSPQN